MARKKQFLIVLGSCVGMALISGLTNRLVHHHSLDIWVMIGVLCAVGFVLTFFLSRGMARVLVVGMPLLVTIGVSLRWTQSEVALFNAHEADPPALMSP